MLAMPANLADIGRWMVSKAVRPADREPADTPVLLEDLNTMMRSALSAGPVPKRLAANQSIAGTEAGEASPSRPHQKKPLPDAAE